MVHGAERDHCNQQQLEPRGARVRPLGAFERMYYRFSQKSTSHLRGVTELADDLDPAVLDAALSVVHQRHPLLNVYVEDHPQTGPGFCRPPGVPPISSSCDGGTGSAARSCPLGAENKSRRMPSNDLSPSMRPPRTQKTSWAPDYFDRVRDVLDAAC
jgi:hypothetical protein